ncbi:hypothetical protein TKK_0000034 [Trichogramma kaykai]
MYMVMIPSAIIFPVTMPLLLNYVVPGNTSFEPIIITQAYVGFEPREHILPFLFLLLNFGAAMALCLNACSSSLLFAVIFLVVKFKVIGCRLDKLYKRLNDDRVVQFSVEYNQDLLYRHIKELIKDHASCYEVLGQIAALSGNVLFVALGNAIFDLIISGTMIVYQFDNNPKHCLKMGIAAGSALMTGFVLCFFGQVLHQWMVQTTEQTSKVILFMILRSSVSSGILAESYLKLNYETYSSVSSNSRRVEIDELSRIPYAHP